jgi:hypothetical protein
MTIASSTAPLIIDRDAARRRVVPSDRASRSRRRARSGVLGRYQEPDGRVREVVARPGNGGSLLVVDQEAATLGDRRMVAHLAADEPAGNAELVCGMYLNDVERHWCRRVETRDLLLTPFVDDDGEPERQSSDDAGRIVDRHGAALRLERVPGQLSIPELRWCRRLSTEAAPLRESLSVREAVAVLESYEPVRRLTVAALARHCDDPSVSTSVLRSELERVDASRIVLNRGLRQAVLAALERDGLSMSEIAIRCGRVKRDARGKLSGETSWLARRVGLLPEGGSSRPTPWVHSEVLALIARSGLGISPREVELG